MFKIKWTPEAEERYYDTLRYWIHHNKSNVYSLKIIDEVEYKEQLLSANPYIGSIVKNDDVVVRRVLVLDNFSLFYRIQNDVIEIVSFWSNKDNPQKLKL